MGRMYRYGVEIVTSRRIETNLQDNSSNVEKSIYAELKNVEN